MCQLAFSQIPLLAKMKERKDLAATHFTDKLLCKTVVLILRSQSMEDNDLAIFFAQYPDNKTYQETGFPDS
jgi:hypothetical protein